MKQFWPPFLIRLALAASAAVMLSCGSGTGISTSCNPTALTISPTTGTADHTALPPGNQVQYSGMLQYPSGCTVPAIVPILTWTTSDTTDISITGGPANPAVATCLNATPQPATITAALPTSGLKGTASLSCR